jgi:DNA-directed RNA polymerase beta' subunit
MKIDFFNVDQFCENLQSVTTNKIYAKKGFHSDGLFSERIFGPVRTGTCSCGVYWGRSKIGQVCSVCGVTIGYASDRRKKFGKIDLPFKVMNPIMVYLIAKIGKVTISNILNDIIFDDTVIGYYFDEKSKKYVKVTKPTIENEVVQLPEGVILYSGIQGLYDVIHFEAERGKETNSGWKFIYENLDKFFINSIIVCPPEFRPVSKTKDVQMRDKMNEFYMTILNFSLMLKDDVSTYENSEIQMINFRNLQRYVFNFYEYIFSKFSKKTGLIRGSILGKRIDFSARAVIAPDPQLSLDECSIPYVMALELFKLDVVNRLLEKKNYNEHVFVRYDPTIDYVNECIKLNDVSLLSIVQELTANKSVILNRQPTLHRMGLLSFKVKINTDYVIKIHPCICEPYNADFDGDQMATYISLYEETEQESREKFFILANLISPSTGKLILGINQDILLGLYLMTKPYEDKKVVYKNIHTYEGRVRFNSIFPENFPFINKTIDKKQLHVLLNVLAKIYEPEVMKTIIDKIKELGFKETTLRGTTFSLKDLKTGNSFNIVSGIVDDPNKDLKDKYFELQNHPHKKELQETFPYKDFIESGSRGSWDQANQLIFCRGYISNSRGEIVTTPIKHNLVDGLSREEFYISCYGSRKALLDVALNTAVSGYLTRKLVYCAVNLELEESLDDCGTQDHYELRVPEILTEEKINELISHISDEGERQLQREILKHKNDDFDPIKLAKSIIGRWYLNEETHQLETITEDNYLNMCGKTLKLRSPLFCKSPKLCKKCYGESHKYCHSKYIGVIAAQSLGEVATQLTLRTFHIGGIAQMTRSNEGTAQQDIISDLTVVNKLLHGGALTASELLTRLFSIYSRHRVLLHVHFECIVSQLMRIGMQRWRLLPNRNEISPIIISVENVPSKESFLLALAFSKPYNYIVSGIVGSSATTDGILERMLTNKI